MYIYALFCVYTYESVSTSIYTSYMYKDNTYKIILNNLLVK